jgi:cytochrome c nitrite reductase small subunit
MPQFLPALSMLLNLLIGVGAFTFEYAIGFAYFSDGPNVCARCHIMREHLQSWQASNHHGKAVCNIAAAATAK